MKANSQAISLINSSNGSKVKSVSRSRAGSGQAGEQPDPGALERFQEDLVRLVAGVVFLFWAPAALSLTEDGAGRAFVASDWMSDAEAAEVVNITNRLQPICEIDYGSSLTGRPFRRRRCLRTGRRTRSRQFRAQVFAAVRCAAGARVPDAATGRTLSPPERGKRAGARYSRWTV